MPVAESDSWKIYCGDAREVIKDSMPDESVDCIITSPPYYSQRDYQVDGQIGLESTIDEYVGKLVGVFREARRSLKSDGLLFLNIGDTYYSAKGLPKGDDKKHRARRFGLRPVDGPGLGLPRKSLIGIPWRVALALQSDGWTLRSSVIWMRDGAMPEPTAKDRPWRTYENVFIFSKSPKYYFNRDALEGDEDVWRISARPRREDRVHVAPFPDALVERCIATGGREDAVILDPFLGSGTTARVAVSMGRKAIGIDLNPDYCKHAIARLGVE
ncbi:DNA-methyltransferase [uncultured Stenotrophomonas sp.]|uniref:DNA-methyltransferase n=1 Tax=uncultured Stenotrophomonas sp. TaxID=165438 RepID=UPI0025DD60A2|nr:site-specific DNA-methyltransferase [uncultured Stenotrophomonas sp.]